MGWDSWDHCPIHVVMKKEKVSIFSLRGKERSGPDGGTLESRKR